MLQRYDIFVIIIQDVLEIMNNLQKNPQPRWEIADDGDSDKFGSECDWAMPQAGSCSEGSEGCRED
jgi:hypothetical protein